MQRCWTQRCCTQRGFLALGLCPALSLLDKYRVVNTFVKGFPLSFSIAALQVSKRAPSKATAISASLNCNDKHCLCARWWPLGHKSPTPRPVLLEKGQLHDNSLTVSENKNYLIYARLCKVHELSTGTVCSCPGHLAPTCTACSFVMGDPKAILFSA